jgi:hypothetical protein
MFSRPVAALEDVHESKRQADCPKDREYLQRFLCQRLGEIRFRPREWAHQHFWP